MSGVVSSVPTVSDTGSRLTAFSISVTVPSSGRTTYSFSLEWDKKRSQDMLTPRLFSASPDFSEQKTVKDSISSRTLPPSSEVVEEDRHSGSLLKKKASSQESKEKEDDKMKAEENFDAKHDKDELVRERRFKRNRNKKKKHRHERAKSASFRSNSYKNKMNETNLTNGQYENLNLSSFARSARNQHLHSHRSVETRTSTGSLEDCNRLVGVKLYLRLFRPDGEIQERIFTGEMINISTVLDMLRFLLRNVKLPLTEHTFGRLFLFRDEFNGGRIDELAYNTYRHMTLEEIEPQKDEHIFMLDLTDTFVDRPLPDAHRGRSWNV